MAEAIEGLKAGENLLLYPAGHMKRRDLEEVGAASGVKTVLESVPESSRRAGSDERRLGQQLQLGHSRDGSPQLGPQLLRGLRYAPAERPLLHAAARASRSSSSSRRTSRATRDRHGDQPVPRGVLQRRCVTATPTCPTGSGSKGGAREVPEPEVGRMAGDAASVPEAIRRQVFDQLTRVTGRADLALGDELAHDLGLDSLATAELIVWIEQEFGFSVGTPESLETVGDVVLAAAGKGISALEADLKRRQPRWFARASRRERLVVPPGRDDHGGLPDAGARRPGPHASWPTRPAARGAYRDVIRRAGPEAARSRRCRARTSASCSRPRSAPASSTWPCLFAGKTPVMVNWTTGSRNLVHSLDLLGVQQVITARALLTQARVARHQARRARRSAACRSRISGAASPRARSSAPLVRARVELG